MVDTLEREIIEKFHQLDQAAKERVRRLIILETADTTFDYEAWFQEMKAIRQDIENSHDGQFPAMDAIEILHDIRDGIDE